MSAQAAAGASATLPVYAGVRAGAAGAAERHRGPFGGRSAPRSRSKVLTWTTAPLPVPTEVTGYPHVSLWAASSTNDGDMVFSLDDVAPDGTSTQVIQGYLNVPHQASLSAPKPL